MRIYRCKMIYDNYWSGNITTTSWAYFLLMEINESLCAIFRYPETKTIIYNKKTYPESSYKIKDSTNDREIYEMIKKISPHDSKTIREITELDTNYNAYNLALVREYKGYDALTVKIENESGIEENIVKNIERYSSQKMNPVICIGEDFSRLTDLNERYMGNGIKAYPSYLKLYCPVCGKVFKPELTRNYLGDPTYKKQCPHCTNKFTDNILESKDYYANTKEGRRSLGVWNHENRSITESSLYIKAVENGIYLYKISYTVKAENGVFYRIFKIDSYVKYVIGEEVKSVKLLKRGERIIDSFEALNINSKNISEYGNVIYENADTFYEFAEKNAEALKKIGFMEISKNANIGLSSQTFLILYIAIINRYPILEQIIKSGYYSLFFNIYKSIMSSESKSEILEKIQEINQLVDTDATKGSQAFRFPRYIGEFLKSKNASIKEYYAWRDIYEITQISKEQFESIINSNEFAIVYPYIDKNEISNIVKFGYNPIKLFKYLLKEHKEFSNINEALKTLSDYLMMSDIMQVSIDLYPNNLKNAHDRMVDSFNSYKNTRGGSLTVYKIGNQCEEYVLKNTEEKDNKIGVPKALETYTVIFPKTIKEFIDEGNQQHNCVGSYPKLIEQGKSIVFFIRKKETPNESLITAECTRSGLGQMFYSNNRPVHDETLRNLGKYISSKIITGCKSGKINGLNNI